MKELREKVEKWLNRVNLIPTEMISSLAELEGGWTEITTPTIHADRVFCTKEDSYGVITGSKEDFYEVELDNGKVIQATEKELQVSYDEKYPMWGRMFSLDDPVDKEWLRRKDSVRSLSECGFRVFKSEKYGTYFGLDNGGCDFVDQYWTPLYKIMYEKYLKEEE